VILCWWIEREGFGLGGAGGIGVGIYWEFGIKLKRRKGI
jgi:hypothetical protein